MYNIDMQNMTPDFYECWYEARAHLNSIGNPYIAWIKSNPQPPFLEHLSFRYGNQLYFVRVDDRTKNSDGPGSIDGLKMVAEESNGHACLLPMMKDPKHNTWHTVLPGWGLYEINHKKLINPEEMVTTELIKLTKWETHHIATQLVKKKIEEDGYNVISWQGNPSVDPSIWFIGESGGLEWVIVREEVSLFDDVELPNNIDGMGKLYEKQGKIGHFAAINLMNQKQNFESLDVKAKPLYRGEEVVAVTYKLEKIWPKS